MSKISLKTDNGKYVRVKLNNGQLGLWADGDSSNAAVLDSAQAGGNPSCSAPRTINFITLHDGQTKHISLNGETVVLDNSTASPVLEDRQFVIEWQGINEVALKANTGKYVSRDTEAGSLLKANRDCIGPWETFTVEVV